MQVNRKTLSQIFGMNVTTIDDWVSAGCPIVSKGAKGKQAAFETIAVIAWREEQLTNRLPGSD